MLKNAAVVVPKHRIHQGYGAVDKKPLPPASAACAEVIRLGLSFTLFPIGVVVLWRSVWQLLDLELTELPDEANIDDLPQAKWSSVWRSLPAAFLLSFLIDLSQFHVSRALQHSSRIAQTVFVKVAVLLMTVIIVCCWRGIWDLMDVLFGLLCLTEPAQKALLCLILVLLCTLCTWPLRISKSLLSSPLQSSHDDNLAQVIESPTLLGQRPPGFGGKSWSLFIMDTFVSSVLLQILLVSCWWALWSLLHLLIPPDQLWVYLVIGYPCSLAAYAALQRPQLSRFRQNVAVFVGFLGTVSLWIAFWDGSEKLLLSALQIPDKRTNLLVQSLVSYSLLALTNAASLSSSRGVLQDPDPSQLEQLCVNCIDCGDNDLNDDDNARMALLV